MSRISANQFTQLLIDEAPRYEAMALKQWKSFLWPEFPRGGIRQFHSPHDVDYRFRVPMGRFPEFMGSEAFMDRLEKLYPAAI